MAQQDRFERHKAQLCKEIYESSDDQKTVKDLRKYISKMRDLDFYEDQREKIPEKWTTHPQYLSEEVEFFDPQNGPKIEGKKRGAKPPKSRLLPLYQALKAHHFGSQDLLNSFNIQTRGKNEHSGVIPLVVETMEEEMAAEEKQIKTEKKAPSSYLNIGPESPPAVLPTFGNLGIRDQQSEPQQYTVIGEPLAVTANQGFEELEEYLLDLEFSALDSSIIPAAPTENITIENPATPATVVSSVPSPVAEVCVAQSPSPPSSPAWQGGVSQVVMTMPNGQVLQFQLSEEQSTAFMMQYQPSPVTGEPMELN